MKTIKKGKQINSAEFEEMSEILASIDYEAGITDSQFAALAYFADLHDVAIIEVAGIDNAQALSAYAQKKAFENQMRAMDFKTAHDLWLGNTSLCKDTEIVYNEMHDFKKIELGAVSYEERQKKVDKIRNLMKNFNIIRASDLDPKKVH